MLEGFSWQQFLLAALLLTLLWYAVVLLVFYRSFIVGLLSGAGGAAEMGASGQSVGRFRNGGRAVEEGPEVAVAGADSLMGVAKLPEGMSLVEAAELRFVGQGQDRDSQLGLIPDLLAELKRLFVGLAEGDGGKPDFFRLLELLKADFPKMGGHPQIGAVNGFIIDHAPFHLTAEEIENLWY